MTDQVLFSLLLAVTVVLLASVFATGLAAKRRLHIPLVVLTLASLAVTIAEAKELGHRYDLESAGAITPIHLTLAKITTAAYLLPIATGIRTLFAPVTRRLHRKVAFLVLALTIASVITGTWMILAADPVAEPPLLDLGS